MSQTDQPNDQLPLVTLEKLADEKLGSGLKEHETLSNIALREKVAKYLLWLFVGTNTAVLVAIAGLAIIDYRIIGRILEHATAQPVTFEKLLMSQDLLQKTRSVNSSVLMTLIGATAVQVGAGVLTITQYLFPKPLENRNLHNGPTSAQTLGEPR